MDSPNAMLQYTNQRPTEPGWYWARRTKSPAVALIGLVYNHSEVLRFAYFDPRIRAKEDKIINTINDTQWAGPIPRPLPAEETL